MVWDGSNTKLVKSLTLKHREIKGGFSMLYFFTRMFIDREASSFEYCYFRDRYDWDNRCL